MTIHRVEIQPSAELDIEREFRRLEDLVRVGEIRPGYPEEWYEEVEDSIHSLEKLPDRCPFAPEAKVFGRPLRHMVLPNRYRIIFDVWDDTVRVLHIVHQRQNPLERDR